MEPTELLAGLVDRSAPDEWYVTDGATAIGPVGLQLLARGITAGKVPLDAFVKHDSWPNWRRLSDLTEHDPSFDPKKTLRVLRKATTGAHRTGVPRPGSADDGPRETLPSIDLEPIEDEDIDVVDVEGFDAAADLKEALLLLLATAVKDCEAEAALVHGAQADGAVIVCSHGPRMFEMLGDKLPAGDPVLFAAKQGHTLLAEPVSGAAGRATKSRLSRLGTKVDSAFMVPIVVDARLLAMIELGRAKPFRARDVAAVETLVETLVETVKRLGWAREWKPVVPRPR